MNQQDYQNLKELCLATAQEVRAIVPKSANFSSLDPRTRTHAAAWGVRQGTMSDLNVTRGSWLANLRDQIGEPMFNRLRVIAWKTEPKTWDNNNKKEFEKRVEILGRRVWKQLDLDAYQMFETDHELRANLWFYKRVPIDLKDLDPKNVNKYMNRTKCAHAENQALNATVTQTGNCLETSLLAYLALGTMQIPNVPERTDHRVLKNKIIYWVGVPEGLGDHAFVVVSEKRVDRFSELNIGEYILLDPWCATAYEQAHQGCHYKYHQNHIQLNCEDMLPCIAGDYKLCTKNAVAVTQLRSTLAMLQTKILKRSAQIGRDLDELFNAWKSHQKE